MNCPKCGKKLVKHEFFELDSPIEAYSWGKVSKWFGSVVKYAVKIHGKKIMKLSWTAPGYGSKWDTIDELYGLNIKPGIYCLSCVEEALDKAKKDRSLMLWPYPTWRDGDCNVCMVDRKSNHVLTSKLPEFSHVIKRYEDGILEHKKRIKRGLRILPKNVKRAFCAAYWEWRNFYKGRKWRRDKLYESINDMKLALDYLVPADGNAHGLDATARHADVSGAHRGHRAEKRQNQDMGHKRHTF